MPVDHEIAGIWRSLESGRRTALAERDQRLREEMLRSGQQQELREYDDRQAAAQAAARKEQALNKLAAMYLGGPSQPDTSSRLLNHFAGPQTPGIATNPAFPPSGASQAPINILAAPGLGATSPGAMPGNSTSTTMARGAPGTSRLNWGNLSREELMRDMIEADPKRAREIQAWGDEQWRNEALQDYRKLEQVFTSSNPKQLAQRLTPDLIEGLVEDGHSLESLSDDQFRSLAQSMMAELSPLAGISGDTPLETVVGPGGSPLLLPRSQAAGKRPYEKPQGAPSSYDEFLLSQKDPGFAAFLKSRRGKGISMTMPDGTVVEIGGEGGGIGPQDLSGPTTNRLQEAIVQSTDELDRLNSIGQGFDPKFLEIPGRLRGAGLKVKDLAGGMLGELSAQEREYLTKFSTFKADAAKNLSSILNRLSGAAISPAEGERLKKGIPNDGDSPTQFIAKYQAAVKDSTRAIMRANWALKNGIGVNSVDQLSRSMPLESIDQVYAQRANEIWQELGGAPETREEAVQRANREFGRGR